MSHIALYRAWRPQNFRDIVGQQPIIQTLQNAIAEQRISHAYLFNGPRGTGKTTAAKVFAKAINCEAGPAQEPCNDCEACKGITGGSLMDVIEIDAASNRGIDEIRDIRERVRYAPSEVRYKVYIIDEVHMLTTEAFNALLKTLEEPPGHVVFILATTEPHKLPATIISRCQRFDFRQVSLPEQLARLQQICQVEGFAADEDALAYIARLSDGGMRDAIGLLEQTAAFAAERITLEAAIEVTGGMAVEHFARLAEAIARRDVAGVLTHVEDLMVTGKSPDKCLENLVVCFRDLLLLQMVPEGQGMTERLVDVERFRALAAAFAQERLFSMIEELHRYQVELKHAPQPQTVLEIALLKLCTLPEGGGQASPAGAGASASVGTSTSVGASTSMGTSTSVGTSTGAADRGYAEQVERLEQKVQALERKLEQLLRAGSAIGAPAAGALAGAAPQEASTGTARSAPGGRSGGGGGGFGPRSAGTVRAPVRLDPYLASRESELCRMVTARWAEVLQRVKEAGISIHAWLINGEPVSATEDAVLIAFKNTIHRETTEKPSNRAVIEQVLQNVYGRPISFATIMLKDWLAAAEHQEAAAEPLELETLEQNQESAGRPEWVEEAIRLFGEELVVVTNEEK